MYRVNALLARISKEGVNVVTVYANSLGLNSEREGENKYYLIPFKDVKRLIDNYVIDQVANTIASNEFWDMRDRLNCIKMIS